MRKTTKAERKQNAKAFYNELRFGSAYKRAVVIRRLESENPNIRRCQFVVSENNGTYRIIADSTLGVEGCFIEFIDAACPCVQRTIYEEGFRQWLELTVGIRLTYDDGLVMMWERA